MQCDSTGRQLSSCEFEGHGPYFMLLLEESWVASPEFKIARIAAARKFLLIAHAIYESGEPFHSPNEKEGWHSIQHLTPIASQDCHDPEAFIYVPSSPTTSCSRNRLVSWASPHLT